MNDAPKIDVPERLRILSLELQIQSASKGAISDVRINFIIHRPNQRSLKCTTGFTPESPFPSLESLLRDSVETITKEYRDDLNPQEDEG